MPAILVHSEEELTHQLEKLTPYFDNLQIDIANNTLGADQIIAGLNRVADKLARPLTIDFDLMISDYQTTMQKLTVLSPKITRNNLFLRPKTITQNEMVSLQNQGFTVGLALDPDDSPETIEKQFELTNLPVIQVMTVAPGAQGRHFMPEQLKKIEQLRNAGYRNKVFLDGGINEETLKIILQQKFRPDVLCVGSYFSNAENIEERITSLRQILGENQSD